MIRLIWILQATTFFLFTWLVALMPVALYDRAGLLLGKLMFLLLSERRKIAEDNISRSLDYMRAQPEWNHDFQDAKEIARETFHNLGRSLIETCALYHGKGKHLIDNLEVVGQEYCAAAHKKGKGTIFLTGHCGNWELVALAYAQLFNTSMSVVARRQDNPYLNRMVEHMRMRYNNKVIYKNNALKNMISVIRSNGLIGLLADQAASAYHGCLVEFLGQPAWASKAPVLLARKTGVAVIPSFIHRKGGNHQVEFYPALVFDDDKSEEGWQRNVKLYSEAIERFIIKHPTQWYWVHKRWKKVPPDAAACCSKSRGTML